MDVTPDGTEVWAVLLDADHHAIAGNITVDPSGDLVVTGGTLILFGHYPTPPGTELLGRDNPEGSDAFLRKYGL